MKLPEPVPPAAEQTTTTRSRFSISRPRWARSSWRPTLRSSPSLRSRTRSASLANWSKNSSREIARTWPAPFSVLISEKSAIGSQSAISG